MDATTSALWQLEPGRNKTLKLQFDLIDLAVQPRKYDVAPGCQCFFRLASQQPANHRGPRAAPRARKKMRNAGSSLSDLKVPGLPVRGSRGSLFSSEYGLETQKRSPVRDRFQVRVQVRVDCAMSACTALYCGLLFLSQDMTGLL